MNEASKKRLAELREQAKSFPKQKCEDCGEEIWHESPDEDDIELSDGTILCRNCYFKRLGKEFDEHPYISPRILALMGAKKND
jgi:DNA-directed RNA polymerase subunit RPC12/RpoP